MIIKKRHIATMLFLILLLPFLLVGFIVYWLKLGVEDGWEIGEITYKWIKGEVND